MGYLDYYSQKPNSFSEDGYADALTPQYTSADVPKYDAGNSAAMGGAMSGAAGAGIGVTGSLLSSYLAQKAADERKRRETGAEIAQNQASGEQNSMKFLDSVYRGALR